VSLISLHLVKRLLLEVIFWMIRVTSSCRGMIRQAIQNLRRRQSVTQHLFPEILGNPNPRDHANLHCWSAFSEVAADREPPGGDALT